MASPILKQSRKDFKSLMKTRKSTSICPRLLSTITYQQNTILKHSSFFTWCFSAIKYYDTPVLDDRFKEMYEDLTKNDQLFYYEASIILARQLNFVKKQKKEIEQDLPKYPWEEEEQKEKEPKLDSAFFQKIGVFYISENESTETESSEQAKVLLEVISAQGHYMQLKVMSFDEKLMEPTGQNTNPQLIHSPQTPNPPTKSSNKNHPPQLIIDLRHFLLHSQPNPQDSKHDYFVLTRFLHQQQQPGQNRVISSNSIQQLYLDIRSYYSYKTRKFSEFYSYSFRDYLRQRVSDTQRSGIDVVLKAKKHKGCKEGVKGPTHKGDGNNVTSLEYLNDENFTGRRFVTGLEATPDQENYSPKSYLHFKHPTHSIDSVTNFQTLNSIASQLKQIPLNRKHQKLWMDWKKDKTGLLIYVNEQKLSDQRAGVKLLLKKILSNIFNGKSVFSTSLPVTIFQNVSLVQKVCRCFGYAPLAFEQISKNPYKSQDVHLQVKSILTIMMGVSILYIQQMAKPFNSVLGQTYQGLINGCPIYAEQTSHHPPVTSFFMKGKGYFIYGSLEPTVSFSMNKIVGSNKGFVSVAFDSENYQRNVMSFTFPDTEMGGLIMGERTIKRTGVSYIFCEARNLFGRVEWGPKPQSGKKESSIRDSAESTNPSFIDYMSGSLYKLNLELISVSKQNHRQITPSHYQTQLLHFEGNWTSSLFINNQKQFNFQTSMPYTCQQYPLYLQSHSNRRLDIVQKKEGQLEKSQEEKERVEERQRRDRKLREEYRDFKK